MIEKQTDGTYAIKGGPQLKYLRESNDINKVMCDRPWWHHGPGTGRVKEEKFTINPEFEKGSANVIGGNESQ